MEGPKIIAMWSGPRNLSTAMMRSFGSRADCQAVDEPFYAAYLAATGFEHPMRSEVIAAGETDAGKVIDRCLNPATTGQRLTYQKHMSHHMIDAFDTNWISKVTNVFLIRSPDRVLASYAKKAERVSANDLGYKTQRRLFDFATERVGQHPPVVDAAAIRGNPEGMLRTLCMELEIPFDPAMLEWTAGPKPEDGIWAKHWYGAVWNSTGFAPPDQTPEPKLAPVLQAIHGEVREDYEYLRQFCLKPTV